jgi:hypothetical protein
MEKYWEKLSSKDFNEIEDAIKAKSYSDILIPLNEYINILKSNNINIKAFQIFKMETLFLLVTPEKISRLKKVLKENFNYEGKIVEEYPYLIVEEFEKIEKIFNQHNKVLKEKLKEAILKIDGNILNKNKIDMLEFFDIKTDQIDNIEYEMYN